jgi:FMN phosphatase YigB (HAD superfamily)
LLRLYPGVEEALRYMQQQRIAIVGYTESAEENGFYRLKKLGIEQYFKKIYVSDSTYKRSDYTEKSPKTQIVHGIKPNPELLKQICQDEECLFTEAIYMGDSLTKDIMMAKEAGIISVWVDIPEQNPDLYKQLIQISHWSEADFTREKENREKWERCAYSPDYTITDLGQLEQIIKQINYPCLSDIGTNKR